MKSLNNNQDKIMSEQYKEYLACFNESYNIAENEIANLKDELYVKKTVGKNYEVEYENRIKFLKNVIKNILKLRSLLIDNKLNINDTSNEKTKSLIELLQNKNDIETIKLAKLHCDDKNREFYKYKRELSTYNGILQNAIFNSQEIMSQAPWKIDFDGLSLESNSHYHTLLSEYLQDDYHQTAEFHNARISFSDEDIYIHFLIKKK